MLDPGVVEAAARRSSRPPRRHPVSASLFGPGVLVAVAYVDPGNVAVNAQAGAEHGSRLLWVVGAASAAAMLLQYLSAKLGSVTGVSLPALSRERYPRALTVALWVQAEIVIAATEVAEVVGGAVALHWLLGVDVLVGAALVLAISAAIFLVPSGDGYRFRRLVAALLAVIAVAFAYQLVRVGLDLGAAMAGLRPRAPTPDVMPLAAGIVGATVMPHAVYLHSGLSSGRTRRAAGRLSVAWHRRDVLVALGLATAVNMSILLVGQGAASRVGEGVALHTLDDMHAALGYVGTGAGWLFAVALLASGVASTLIGGCAGDVVMAGYLGRRVPAVLRRGLTMTPVLLVLGCGVEPTSALLASQIVLCLGIPLALGPLLHLTASRSAMGQDANRPWVTAAALLLGGLIVALGAASTWQALG